MREESGIQIVISLDSSVRSTPERELVVYQIAREALVNAVHHSKARTIWLSIRREAGSLQAEIADDGRGFDPTDTSRLHFGLSLMNERALEIGAELEVRSSPGSGTVVRLSFKS
jgi:two-component system nitrate/nitrite sensor histidine kinase NarQ